MIILKRDSGWVHKTKAYNVILDGDLIGEINNGEEK